MFVERLTFIRVLLRVFAGDVKRCVPKILANTLHTDGGRATWLMYLHPL